MLIMSQPCRCCVSTIRLKQDINENDLCFLQVKGVVTLKLGAFKAPHHEMSGLVLSMDWLPDKPHNIMAIGFYDGMN